MDQTETTPIARQMTALGVSHNSAAAFIGVTVNWMWDLYSYDDEAWTTLSLVQLCRLMILLSLNVKAIVLNDYKSGQPSLEPSYDQQGVLQVAGPIRTRFGTKKLDPKKSEWDPEDVKRWLSDDEELADIPVPALHDICAMIGIDTCSVIDQYMAKLGRPIPNIA